MSNTVYLQRTEQGTSPISDFVVIPFATDGLLPALKRLAKAASSDPSRHHLHGVLFDLETRCLVATDGHRLHVVECPQHSAEELPCLSVSFIVPTWALTTWQQIAKQQPDKTSGTLTYDPSSQAITFELGSTVLTCAAIDAKYPPYEQVIPKDNTHRVTISAGLLKKALREAKKHTDEHDMRGHAPRILALTSDTLYVLSPDEQYSGAVPATGSLEASGRVAVQVPYLLDAIDFCATGDRSAEVTIAVRGKLDPILVTSAYHTAVVMPCRVD